MEQQEHKIYKSHQRECWTDFFWGAVFMVEGLNGGGGPHVGCRLKFHYFVACQLNFPGNFFPRFVGSQ